MPATPRPTRSPSTLKAYPARARGLIQRCRRQLNISPHDALDYRRLVGWLIGHKVNINDKSWRQYKASVAFFLEQEVARQQDPVAEEALQLLLAEGSEGCQKSSRKTSATKLKKFPIRDFKRLTDYLDSHPSPWADDLLHWLAAGILTGLRPVEWGQSTITLVQGEPAMIVTNAKATNNRAHGPTRTLLMGGLSDEERAGIAQHVDRAVQFREAGKYTQFMQGCANTLARAARRLWPRRDRYPTLYSLRHQFSADAKASGLSMEELAALMGHAVDTTATQHYGRRSAGLEMVRVRPDPAEVARVRQVFRQRFERPQPAPTLDVQPKPQAVPRLRPADDSAR
jgi:integrase